MKVLIIEDEEAATRRLQKMIGEIDPEMDILAALDSIEASVRWFSNHTAPDLILLDIHLADGSGFELFEHIAIQQPVIFTTAYDQYALQAFKVNAVDYLLKPIKKRELQRALEKYQRTQPSDTPVDYTALMEAISPVKHKRFLIKTGQQIKVFSPEEIAYFFTQNKLTYLVSHEGKKYALDQSLDKVEDTVNRQRFFRINRQFIIGLKAIKNLHVYSKSRVKIELDPPCPLETIVSTERSPHFKKWLVGE